MEIELRELVLSSGIKEPLLFKGLHANWGPVQWDLDQWGRALVKDPGELLPCRLGHRRRTSLVRTVCCQLSTSFSWSGNVGLIVLCIDIEQRPEWEWMRRRVELKWGSLCNWNSEEDWVVYDYKNLAQVLTPSYQSVRIWIVFFYFIDCFLLFS
jgi:hypothetical protein